MWMTESTPTSARCRSSVLSRSPTTACVVDDVEGSDVVPGPAKSADHAPPGPPAGRSDQDHLGCSSPVTGLAVTLDSEPASPGACTRWGA